MICLKRLYLSRMFKTKITTSDSRIKPIKIQGMNGRVLTVEAKDKKFNKHNILLIYGHHASLERYLTVAEALSDFGSVTVVDLPGFGGMDSFRKVGKKPNIDNFAEYMAGFLSDQNDSEKVTVVGVSYGLAIASRMLQLHPELVDRVDAVVSIAGFTHHRDFKLPKSLLWFYWFATGVLRNYPVNLVLRTLITNDVSISLAYGRYGSGKSKFAGKSKAERKQTTREEILLWQINDFWTYAWVGFDTVTLNLLTAEINVPLLHVLVSGDQYFDSNRIKSDMKTLYPRAKFFHAETENHAPTSFENADEIKQLIPKDLGVELLKLAKSSSQGKK